MKYDYIKEHNAFFALIEEIDLSPLAQLLWYKLQDVRNRTYGKGTLIISNYKLADMLGTANIKKASSARSELVKCGLISYGQGTKSNAGKYQINSAVDILHGKIKFNDENDIQSANENNLETDRENDCKKGLLKEICTESDSEYEQENNNQNDIVFDREYDCENENLHYNNKIKSNIKSQSKIKTACVGEEKTDGFFCDDFSDNSQRSGCDTEELFNRFREIYPKKKSLFKHFQQFHFLFSGFT